MRIDDQENIYNQDGVLIGVINGFLFVASNDISVDDEEVNSFIVEAFTKKIDKLVNEGDAALRLNEVFHVTYNNAVVAHLEKTEDIFKPNFTPILDDRIQGLSLARLALHLESWLKRQLNAAVDPLDILKKTEDLSPQAQEFIDVIISYLGYAPRHKIDAVVKQVTPDDRTKLRKAGVRFAQYGVFVRDMLKPGAQRIKLILWALKNGYALPEFPPSGVVTIPCQTNIPDGYYDIAGYKICGEYAVRADMIEKLADAIRPIALKSDSNPKGEFEITANHMSYIGKSGEVFDVVMKSLGYNYRIQPVVITSVSLVENSENANQTDQNKILSDQHNTTSKQGFVSEEVSEELKSDVTISKNTLQEEVAAEKISDSETQMTPSELSSDPQESSDSVSIVEKQVDKKIWFWVSNIKPRSEFKKPFTRSPKKEQKTNSETDELPQQDSADQKKGRFKHSNSYEKRDHAPNNSFDKKNKNSKQSQQKNRKFSDQSEKTYEKDEKPPHSPYVNMPGRHKVSNENNPFAALMALKK